MFTTGEKSKSNSGYQYDDSNEHRDIFSIIRINKPCSKLVLFAIVDDSDEVKKNEFTKKKRNWRAAVTKFFFKAKKTNGINKPHRNGRKDMKTEMQYTNKDNQASFFYVAILFLNCPGYTFSVLTSFYLYLCIWKSIVLRSYVGTNIRVLQLPQFFLFF